ncbi:RHS repeat-associated core domain-containing protein [Janthinobacterium lividum]|uniref:RHS repeat-associated core domain-containing protein n=2 Tax=Janthinobacterium lividum TaxID=29581 RepID=A0AB38C7A7_9BURK|nr:RHS repeat-associated core domain-containing protein [Janthinobacterium lividum]
MVAGQAYAVSVTMRNSGTTKWTYNYTLAALNRVWGVAQVQVAYDVANPAQYTFNFTVTAPSVPGYYNFQWQMQGSEPFEAASPSLAVQVMAPPVTPVPPVNAAQFIGQEVPASMIAGQTYPVTVSMKNTGTSIWTPGASGYLLGAINLFGNTTPFIQLNALPGPVSPGQVGTFSFNVTAPANPGTYPLQWKLVQTGGDWFGSATPDIAVNVTSQQNPTPTNQAKMGAIMAAINLILDADDDSSTVPPQPPLPPETSTGPVSIGEISQLNNADAGALPGTMSVSTGATTYHLPINLPPGIAGTTPALSLNYSSTNVNGVAGLGWSIGSPSRIDRCGRTVATNGITDAARFVPADRLCLDGTQLILVNGDSSNDAAYWSDTAEYRTEIERFSRIRAAQTNGRRTFRVEGKDGMTFTYGDRDDAYLNGQGRTDGLAHRWWLASSTDRSGNRIEYGYTKDGSTGESQLATVRWGGNTAANKPMFAKAELSYEGRPDARPGYISGSHVDERLRLKNIVTYTNTQADGNGGSVALRYNLAYQISAVSGRSLLESVQACDAGGTCLPATKFSWGKKAPGALAQFTSLGGIRQGPNLAGVMSEADAFTNDPQGMIAIADFNGDGKSDLIERYRTSDNGYQQRLFLSNADGNGWTVSRPMANISGHIMETGDFDGDGQIDLLVADQAAGQYPMSNWRLCHSRLRTGGGFVCSTPLSFPANAFTSLRPPRATRLVMDVNGDGRDDLFLSGEDLPNNRHRYRCLSTGNGFNCMSVEGTDKDVMSTVSAGEGHVASHADADMDADGRSDHVSLRSCTYSRSDTSEQKYWECPEFDTGPVRVGTWRVEGSAIVDSTVFPFPNKQTVTPDPVISGVLTGDFNGDGITDIILGLAKIDASAYQKEKSAHICYFKGTGRADCRALPASGGAYDHQVVTVGDFDGDGIVDVLRPKHDTWETDDVTTYQLCHVGPDAAWHRCEDWQGPRFYADSGRKRYTPSEYGHLYDPKAHSRFSGDFDGDGKPDIVTYLGGSNWEIFSAADQATPGEAIDKLMSATNGLGFVERVEYATANDASVYQDVAYDIRGQAVTPVYPLSRAPNRRQLVKTLHRSNGQGGWLSSQYRYAGNANDGSGRGNLGFARIDVTDVPSGHVTTSWYRQDFPFIGMVSAVQTTPDRQTAPVPTSKLLNETINTPDALQIPQANGRVTWFPYFSASQLARHDLDGSDMGTVTTSYRYDTFGNLLEKNEQATVADGDSYTANVVNIYDSNVSLWRLGDLKSITQRNTNTAGAITRKVEYDYDTQGRVITEVRQGNDARLKLTTTYDRSRNPFGLANKTTQEWTDPLDGSTKRRVVSDVEYSAEGRFPIWTKNALGQTTNSYTTYDAATGIWTQRSDINQLPYAQTVDAFGRIRSETGPDRQEARTDMKQCDTRCPAGAVAVTIKDQFKQGGRSRLPTLMFSDSAGHVLRTQSWGFDGRVTVIDSRYDARGRIHEQDQPRFSDAPAVLASRQEYDDLNRVVSTVTLNEQGTPLSATIQYQGLTTVQMNAKGQRKTDQRDVKGKLTKSIDALSGTTGFRYDALGNLIETTDPMSNRIGVVYDALGRKTDLNDPDLGQVHYEVDPVGQVRSQASKLQQLAGKRTTMAYDALGRMTARDEDDMFGRWLYDQPVGQTNCAGARSCGQLVEAYTQRADGKKDYRRLHSYDSLGRPDMVTTHLDVNIDMVYTARTEYDAWDRPLRMSYQRGSESAKAYEQRYNARGYLESIVRGPLVLWQATAQDANNRVTLATLGNGLSVERNYDPYTGRLSQGTLKNGQGTAQLNESYNYDALGNVKQRAQFWPGVSFTEEFDYDNLNRLTLASVSGQTAQVFTYDAIGNLTSKTGVGAYTYPPQGAGSDKPHAVRNIDGLGAFVYDANGNLKSGAGRSLNWTSFDMPASIAKGAENSTFAYGPNYQRARQSRSDGTSIYYAGAMEVEIKGGAATVKTYWPQGLGVEIEVAGGAPTFNWTHLDRLGSVVAISDATGAMRERLAYDGWGKRRNLGGEATPDSLDGVTDNRGFTGHEMLDRLDLVHMNGRVYDPQVARFMSADPIIQDLEHSQSYNRYTYVWNNPTNLTDPTGFVTLSNIGSWVSSITAQICGEKVNCWMQNGVPTVTNSGQESTGSNSTETSGGNGAKTPKVSSANTTNWTGGQTKDMTASQAAGTAVEGLKGDPIVNTIATVVVTGKKMVSDAYNWAFGDKQASALAKQDLWANKIHYANGLMAIGMLRGGNPAARNYYRGAKPGTNPSFTPRPGDYKVDPVTGFVKDTHGVSIFDNAASVSSKGFDPHLINMNSMPDTLRIIQRGADPRHFEVVPQPGANLTPQQFINACSSIVCK